MTNHVHWIAIPQRDDSLAVLFRRVHGRYAQYRNAKRRRVGHLWQNRFFSCALAPGHLWAALRYVEWNPVRAGVVGTPEAYRWSSAGVGRESQWAALRIATGGDENRLARGSPRRTFRNGKCRRTNE